jgi:putative transcriptional regulator
MAEDRFLTGQLLIAMPSLADPNFSQTVTLICEHSDRGSLGIVINRPMPMRMGEVFEQLSLQTVRPSLHDLPVLRGGPVQPDRGFVIHTSNVHPWESSMEVAEGLIVTTSRDILKAIALGDGPEKMILALGYAGWDAGQLEAELCQNAWLNAPCDHSIVFDVPFEARWHAAARVLGVDMTRLSRFSGRA